MPQQNSTFQVEPSQSCLSAVKSMRSCPACQGLPAIPPCPGYCLNIMKGCLAHHYQVDDLWARFIGKIMFHIQTYAHSHKYPPPHTNLVMSKPSLENKDELSNCVYLSDSLTSLSERLVGPFNVEMTVEPISIKISDAIMNFQESGFQVADFNQLSIINVYPLWQKCTPPLIKYNFPLRPTSISALIISRSTFFYKV